MKAQVIHKRAIIKKGRQTAHATMPNCNFTVSYPQKKTPKNVTSLSGKVPDFFLQRQTLRQALTQEFRQQRTDFAQVPITSSSRRITWEHESFRSHFGELPNGKSTHQRPPGGGGTY